MNEDLVRMGPKEVRVIIHGVDGQDEMVGIMATDEAFDKAQGLGE